MNVNDLICVGAEPLALLDYLAVERADPELLVELAAGLRAGAEQAGVEIPGGEVCQLPEVIRGHPSPYGFDLVGSAFGTVALDRIVDGSGCAPGDALIGLPASRRALQRPHARPARAARRRRPGARTPRRTSSPAPASPTSCSSRPSSTCAPCSTFCARRHPRPRARAHHRRRHAQPAADRRPESVTRSTRPLPVPPVFDLIAAARWGQRGRDVGGLQHGLRFLRDGAR